MSKYENLDKAIMNKMGGHPQMCSAINVRDVRAECERIAAAEAGKAEAFRILDRRLQALRKAGKIKSTSKGWLRVGANQI
ncbi:hypothetical protein [Duganella vulcania]|uniref:Uncharacterized protein n=1 Tax=Duganella vulcania TaxID=2692166 RepID=A0A845GIQ4_9BURK|nr:hypothetical protein [Duganella vulcania]MYM92637.1 hypothetical protein [Duganella vulcania]